MLSIREHRAKDFLKKDVKKMLSEYAFYHANVKSIIELDDEAERIILNNPDFQENNHYEAALKVFRKPNAKKSFYASLMRKCYGAQYDHEPFWQPYFLAARTLYRETFPKNK